MTEHLPLWRRAPGGFVPADDDAEESFRSMKVGEIVRMRPRRMRNPGHHRKFFALLKMCVENSEGWQMESLLDYVKIETGHFTPYTIPIAPGVLLRRPKSISWANMGQEGFDKLYSGAINVLLRDVVPHISEDELRHAVEMNLVTA